MHSAKSPDDITALDVIQAVDPPPVMDKCPLDLAEHRDHLCPLHSKLARTYALIEDAFRQSTLRDLVGNDTNDSGCRFPAGSQSDKEGDS